jgi:hypothetical protein
VTYAGGGGGSSKFNAGTKGLGQANGGNGSDPSTAPTNASANYGSGGGGSHAQSPAGSGGNGGSGIVIIRYPDSQAALTSIGGGLTYSTTTTGGYRIYSFTAGTGTVTI